jgi:hypothetical protein
MRNRLSDTLLSLARAEVRFVIAGADTVLIDGQAVRIAGIETLIELKRGIQPPRPKDVLDLKELERLRQS